MRLPKAEVVMNNQKIELPETTRNLDRYTQESTWGMQHNGHSEPEEWLHEPFYPMVGGRRCTAERAAYYTAAHWELSCHLYGVPKQTPNGRLGELRAPSGGSPGSSREEVVVAFRAKVRDAHPDGGGDIDKFQELVTARDALLIKR